MNRGSLSLTDILLKSQEGVTIKGIWQPRNSQLEPGQSPEVPDAWEPDKIVPGTFETIDVDWLDTPEKAPYNAYVLYLGENKQAKHLYLNTNLRSGDIVFFGPKGTLISYVPRSFTDTVGHLVGELGKYDIVVNDLIQDSTIQLEKLDPAIQEKIRTSIQNIKTTDTSTVKVTGDGTVANPIVVNTHLSDASSNALSVDDRVSGGLLVHNMTVQLNPVTHALTFTDNKGKTVAVDLSSVQDDDIYLKGASLDSSNKLILEMQGRQGYTVDLSELEKIFTQDTNSITLTGTGTDRSLLRAQVIVNPVGNALKETVQGLHVTTDLSKYDNSTSDFAKKSDIKNQDITITPELGLSGGGTFSQNQALGVNVPIGLSTTTLQNIQEGKDQHSWGDHRAAGYTVTDTKYLAGTGIKVQDTTISAYLDAQEDNILEIQDGIYARNSKIHYRNSTNTLHFTDNKGKESILDLSALTKDIRIESGSLDAGTLNLKLQEGGQDISIDLSELTKVNIKPSSSITLSGDGRELTELKAVVNLDPLDNAIQNTLSGLKVSKDLSLMDNSKTGFISDASVQDGKLTVTGKGGLTGSGTFSQNSVQNSNIELELSLQTNDRIAKGELANSWGNHASAGYTLTDTKYTTSAGIRNVGNDIQADIDVQPDNIISVQDGLFAGNTKVHYRNSTNTIHFTDNKGKETVLDLSDLTKDIRVKSAALDGSVLVLKFTGDAPDISVNLNELTKTQTEESNTFSMSGDGRSVSRLRGDVKVSALQNALEATTTGLRVNPDLSLFDNSKTNFASGANVGEGNLTVSASDGITGGGVFSANQSDNVNITLKLDTPTLSNVQKGQEAFTWGDHAQKGYLTSETTYTASNGIKLVGTDAQVDISLQDDNIVRTQGATGGLYAKNSKLHYRGIDNTVVFIDNKGVENELPLLYDPAGAKKADIGDGELTILSSAGLEGSGTFKQNSPSNKLINIGLSQITQETINKGVVQESWGNHSKQGYVKVDTTYVSEVGSGITIQGNSISAHVDTQDNNALTLQDGLFAQNSSIYYKNSANTLHFTDNKGVETVLDLSGLTKDVHVQSGSLAANVLTLKFSDDQVTTIDLGELTRSNTEDTNSIKILGDGRDTSKLKASVILDPGLDNAIIPKATGLSVTKDLHRYDNSIAQFVRDPDLGKGVLTLTSSEGIEGTGTFGANDLENKSINFKLTSDVLHRIGLGDQAHGWGDHAQVGYVKDINLEQRVIEIIESLGYVGNKTP